MSELRASPTDCLIFLGAPLVSCPIFQSNDSDGISPRSSAARPSLERCRDVWRRDNMMQNLGSFYSLLSMMITSYIPKPRSARRTRFFVVFASSFRMGCTTCDIQYWLSAQIKRTGQVQWRRQNPLTETFARLKLSRLKNVGRRAHREKTGFSWWFFVFTVLTPLGLGIVSTPSYLYKKKHER